jgi:hypothetical protein
MYEYADFTSVQHIQYRYANVLGVPCLLLPHNSQSWLHEKLPKLKIVSSSSFKVLNQQVNPTNIVASTRIFRALLNYSVSNWLTTNSLK